MRAQTIDSSGVRRFGVDAGELVGLRLVGDVLVQRAVGLLLAAKKLEIRIAEGDRALRKEEDRAGFQALAPFAMPGFIAFGW